MIQVKRNVTIQNINKNNKMIIIQMYKKQVK